MVVIIFVIILSADSDSHRIRAALAVPLWFCSRSLVLGWKDDDSPQAAADVEPGCSIDYSLHLLCVCSFYCELLPLLCYFPIMLSLFP